MFKVKSNLIHPWHTTYNGKCLQESFADGRKANTLVFPTEVKMAVVIY